MRYEDLNAKQLVAFRMRAWRNGLTTAQLRALFEEVGWACQVCSRPWNTDAKGGGLTIDHDHNCCTSQAPDVAVQDRPKQLCGDCIRGVLCYQCNNTVGMVADSPETLRLLADYLESGVRIAKKTLNSVDMKPRGVNHARPLAKFSDEQVYEIDRRRAGGATYKEIALEYGVDPQTISNVVNRRTYSHLPKLDSLALPCYN